MPTLRTVVAGALPLFLASASVQTFPTCANAQLSCHNTSAVTDTCCFNSPGGQLLQTQFWTASPSTGPANSWTIHGLWPDHCDGTYSANCDASRAYTNITEILNAAGQTSLLAYMNQYWLNDDGTNEEFWEHEWGKHGTCISTLEPSCYTNYQPQEEVVQFFTRAVALFKTLDTYSFLSQAGITPSSSKTYSLAAMNAALSTARGVQATFQCVNGAVDEVWYSFDVRGSITDGTFVPEQPVGSTTNCPATVKYLPKSGSNAPTSSAPGSTPTPTPRSLPAWAKKFAA